MSVCVKCPVCNGSGHVYSTLYSGLPVTTTEPCRSCNGSGVLWAPTTKGSEPWCIATDQRIRWALLRSTMSPAQRGLWLGARLTMGDARQIALAAHVNLAALFLPDPSRIAMAHSWLLGRWRKLRAGSEATS